MKIIFLDGYTINPGDLSWDLLDCCGDLTVYDRTAPHEVMERAVDADILIVNKTPLTREHFEAFLTSNLYVWQQQVMIKSTLPQPVNMAYTFVIAQDIPVKL